MRLRRCLLFFIFFTFKYVNNFSNEDYFYLAQKKKTSKFYILHGLLNSKTVDLIINLKNKKTEPNGDRDPSDCCFALAHILWQLLKLNFFYKEAIDGNKYWFINFKVFGFEYGPKYKFIGMGGKKEEKDHCCIFKDQNNIGHKCILSRVGFLSFDGGIEFSYRKNKRIRNKHYFACSIACSITLNCGLPDFIIRYCPFIYSYKNNFYLRFEFIQLSIGNIVSCVWSYKHDPKPENEKKICRDIFLNGILRSILYNIKIEIGKSFYLD